MAEAVDVWRYTLDAGAMHDRRNGTCRRCLLGALGDIERDVPRTRHFCPTGVPKGCARRAPEIDRAIPAGVVPGLSTRKVGEVLLALPGRPVPAATVSRVARTLDRSVAAFHRRPLKNDCKAVMPDGALGRPVPVAPGIRHDGRKEIVDFRRAGSGSAAERERFLDRPYHRGLPGEGLEMTGVDGGKGLRAALPIVRHGIPVQRCRAHKIRNILDKVRVAHRQAVMNAGTRPEALAAARRFADHWQGICPGAVASLRNDPDDLLACFRCRTLAGRRQVGTTNAGERRFREVRRRTRPTGTFRDRTSTDRILHAVFIHEDRSRGIGTPLSLTHDS